MAEQHNWPALAQEWAERCGWKQLTSSKWVNPAADTVQSIFPYLPDFANSIDLLLDSLPEGWFACITHLIYPVLGYRWRAEVVHDGGNQTRIRHSDTASHALLLACLAVPWEQT